jgi:transcriptional regulator with XRE-family HTH domain
LKDATNLYKQIGALIRARRTDADLRQEDLADRIHLTRTSVNNFESGRQRIQIETLYDVADALKVQPSELLPPARELEMAKPMSPKISQGLTKEVRDWVTEMSAVSTLTQPLFRLHGGIEDIRTAALKRKLSGMKAVDFFVAKLLSISARREPPVLVETIAQDLGITVRHGPCRAEVVSFVLEQKQGIIIAVNSGEPITRQRFAIAHSFGHLLLHRAPAGFRLDTDFGVTSDPEEATANDFASKLLVPLNWLQEDVGRKKFDFENAEKMIYNLARRYKVSRQVLMARILTLPQR